MTRAHPFANSIHMLEERARRFADKGMQAHSKRQFRRAELDIAIADDYREAAEALRKLEADPELRAKLDAIDLAAPKRKR